MRGSDFERRESIDWLAICSRGEREKKRRGGNKSARDRKRNNGEKKYSQSDS